MKNRGGILGGMAVAFAIIALFTVFLLLPDRDVSALENRTLAKLPSFSFGKFLDGSYQKDLRDYFADQFPFRDFFIRLNMGLDRLGQTAGADYAYRVEGGDGYDYYVYDDEMILALYRDKKPADVADLWTAKLGEAAGWCRKADVDMTLAFFPSKAEAMIPMEPVFHQMNSDHEILHRIFREMPDNVLILDGTEEFRKLPLNELRSRYFKSDNHWNFYGANCAREWMLPRMASRFGFANPARTYVPFPNEQQSMVGAYSRSVSEGSLRDEKIEFYLPEGGKPYQDYVTELEGKPAELRKIFGTQLYGTGVNYSTLTMWNNGLVKIVHENADNDYRLLVIHDSFYNAMALNMSQTFSEQYIVDTRTFKDFNMAAFIEENEIDGVMFFYNSNAVFKIDDHLLFDVQ